MHAVGIPERGNGFTNNIGQSLLFQAAGKTVSQTAASWTGPAGTKGSGYLNGAINGSGLSFTWKGDGGPPDFKGGATITFAGTVNNDGSVNGTATSGSPMSFTSNNTTAAWMRPRQQDRQKPVDQQKPATHPTH